MEDRYVNDVKDKNKCENDMKVDENEVEDSVRLTNDDDSERLKDEDTDEDEKDENGKMEDIYVNDVTDKNKCENDMKVNENVVEDSVRLKNDDDSERLKYEDRDEVEKDENGKMEDIYENDMKDKEKYENDMRMNENEVEDSIRLKDVRVSLA